MEPRFTPGHWVIKAAIGSSGEFCGYEIEPLGATYRGAVARVNDTAHIGGIGPDEARANAHAIKAIPDMFAACEAARDLLKAIGRDSGGTYDDLCRAISKALGGSHV
jgi:hypothetical protein